MFNADMLIQVATSIFSYSIFSKTGKPGIYTAWKNG